MNAPHSASAPPIPVSGETALPGLAEWAQEESGLLRRHDRVLLWTSVLVAFGAFAFVLVHLIAFKRDRDRLATVRTGLPEGHVLWLLGPPDESDGPPLPAHYRPFASDCPGEEPCYPERCVRRVLYYRSIWTSLEVYYDTDGVVQCVERPMVARMDTW